MIGIVDYGMGNLRSVQKALERLGHEASFVKRGSEFETLSKLILPGVGAFGDAMHQLQKQQLVDPIHAFVASGRPFLGICLGMQLIFESSQEDAASPDRPVAGLGLLPGQVVRFAETQPSGARIKVPHMGWNTLQWDRNDPLLRNLEQDAAVYFVHSYYAKPADEADTSATCTYGDAAFCATVWRENLWAAQFHPEKSQDVGLKILDNFANLTD